MASINVALVSRTVYYAPAWTAEHNGYFKDAGLDVRFEVFDNAEKINAAMHAGSMQIAIASVEALVSEAFKGGTFRIVASVTQLPPHFIIAQPEINTLHDLRGKRFGVLSLHEGTTYFVQDLEQSLGMKRGDIIIDAVGGAPTRWKLLRERKIDAGLQPFPLSYESDDAGFSNLGPIARVVPNYEFTVVFLDPVWGDTNRAAVTAFLRALRRGQDAVLTQPADTAAILVKELNTTEAYARQALADAKRLKMVPEGLSPSEAGMRRVFTTLQRAGIVPAGERFDMSRFVDDSYLDAG